MVTQIEKRFKEEKVAISQYFIIHLTTIKDNLLIIKIIIK